MNETEERKLGKDVGFERIRRITGYLVGTLDRWNDAKRCEERDRVRHGLAGPAEKTETEELQNEP